MYALMASVVEDNDEGRQRLTAAIAHMKQTLDTGGALDMTLGRDLLTGAASLRVGVVSYSDNGRRRKTTHIESFVNERGPYALLDYLKEMLA